MILRVNLSQGCGDLGVYFSLSVNARVGKLVDPVLEVFPYEKMSFCCVKIMRVEHGRI